MKSSKTFSIERIGVSGAFFDHKKLDWINQQYLINHIPEGSLWDNLKQWGFSDNHMSKIMPLIHTRIKTFGEFMELCHFLFINHIEYQESLFNIKNINNLSQVAAVFQCMIWDMERQEDWSKEGFEKASHHISKCFELHHKKVIMKLLFGVITGKHHGPPLFDSINILGKDRTRARLLNGISFVGGLSNKKIAELKKQWDAFITKQVSEQ